MRRLWAPLLCVLLVGVLVFMAPARPASAAAPAAVLAPPVGTVIVGSTVGSAAAVALIAFLIGAIAWKAGALLDISWEHVEKWFDTLTPERQAYWESVAEPLVEAPDVPHEVDLSPEAVQEIMDALGYSTFPVVETYSKDGVNWRCYSDAIDPYDKECWARFPDWASILKTYIAKISMDALGLVGKYGYLVLGMTGTTGAVLLLVPETAEAPIDVEEIMRQGAPWPSGVILIQGNQSAWEDWIDVRDCPSVVSSITWLSPPMNNAHFLGQLGCMTWKNYRWSDMLKHYFPDFWKQLQDELIERGMTVETPEGGGFSWRKITEVEYTAPARIPPGIIEPNPTEDEVTTRWDEGDYQDVWPGPVVVTEEKIIVQTEVQPAPETSVDLSPVVQAIEQVRDAIDVARDTITETVERVGDSVDRFFEPGPINWEPLTIQGTRLTTKFPFSLPWDVAHMVGQLDVKAKAPEVTFRLPIAGRIYEVELDLSRFDGLFAGIRWAELAVIVSGSIIAVRRWMGGAV